MMPTSLASSLQKPNKNVLTMVYNTQNHWVCGLFPLSGILITRNTTFQKPDLFLSSGKWRETVYNDKPAPQSFMYIIELSCIAILRVMNGFLWNYT
jgi:hypothetical protein